jgi:prolyl-tRNA editing enzyme YbaK/EbsC (Cys-tRNA(Pro) deacylase)
MTRDKGWRQRLARAAVFWIISTTMIRGNRSQSLKKVKRTLNATGIGAEIREMPASTRTVIRAANAIGCHIDQMAKSIIFRAEATRAAILFITAGANQVSADLAGVLTAEPLGKADSDLIRHQTGFVIGGVAPIGHLMPIRAWFDPRLSEFSQVFAAAGTLRHVFGIAPATLITLTGAITGAFTH